MHLGELAKATFVRRINRFAALVCLKNEFILVHIPNSARMGELLISDTTCYLSPAQSNQRKTKYTLTLVEYTPLSSTKKPYLVCVDSHMANKVFWEAWKEGKIAALQKYQHAKREVAIERSRIDFAFFNDLETCFVEIKSVNLVTDKMAMFPDAPTSRGVRHIRDLISARSNGNAGMIVFIVLRSDANGFKPNMRQDPSFYQEIINAQNAGIRILCYSCTVTKKNLRLSQEIPVQI